MFELQHATRAIEILDDNKVCVACLHPEGGTELLELGLPDKLTTNLQDKGLVKDRDFHFLCGGFHDKHVNDIKQLFCTRKILTNEVGQNCITLWEQAEDSDIYEQSEVFFNKFPEEEAAVVDTNPTDPEGFAFGTNLSNICVACVIPSRIKYNTSALEKSDAIASLHFLDPHCLVAVCRDSGDTWVVDTRQKPELSLLLSCQEHSIPHTSGWVGSLSNRHANSTVWDGDAGAVHIGLLAADGTVVVKDIRGDKDSSVVSTNIQDHLTVFDDQDWAKDLDFHNIQFMPKDESGENRSKISVSGLDANVYIYDILALSHSEGDKTVKPEFIHEGHRACSDVTREVVSTTHIWHPSHTNLLLSAGSDSSFHAWNPVVS